MNDDDDEEQEQDEEPTEEETNEDKDDDANENDADEEEEVIAEHNDDDNSEDDDNHHAMMCNVCDSSLQLYPPGTWSDGWTCDWPGHEGPNEGFKASDPVYGCPTINDCDWGVCQKCYEDFHQSLTIQNEQDVATVFQPEGTKSVYNSSYYCEVQKIAFKVDENQGLVIFIVYYNVRGDMSLGHLQDPSSSTLRCGSNVYHSTDIKVYFSDLYQNRGELIYHIPPNDIELFGTEKVEFIFGESSYSAARLIMPNSTYHECNFPKCSSGDHTMTISDYHDGSYRGGFGCDVCRLLKNGFRWFCGECQSDKCFSCEPIQVMNVQCPTGHDLERCSGNKHGARRCDLCKRSGLVHDPEFYHCTADGYDLCLACASKQQLAKMENE